KSTGGTTLALGRKLVAYVVAADLIGGITTPEFLDDLQGLFTKDVGGDTLIGTNERRPTNWGTHCGASRAPAPAYLEKYGKERPQRDFGHKQLGYTATVFRGWLGERSIYSNFSYKPYDWHADLSQLKGINGPGVKDGLNIDGAFPAEMVRTCSLAD